MQFKLRPEIKAEWVQALRSGQYAQGRGVLRFRAPDDGDSYCCLGVLTDLAVQAKVGTWVVPERGTATFMYGPEESRETTLLADPVIRWAFEDPETINEGDMNLLTNPYLADRQSLARMNDREVSFQEIADRIDREL